MVAQVGIQITHTEVGIQIDLFLDAASRARVSELISISFPKRPLYNHVTLKYEISVEDYEAYISPSTFYFNFISLMFLHPISFCLTRLLTRKPCLRFQPLSDDGSKTVSVLPRRNTTTPRMPSSKRSSLPQADP